MAVEKMMMMMMMIIIIIIIIIIILIMQDLKIINREVCEIIVRNGAKQPSGSTGPFLFAKVEWWVRDAFSRE